MKIKMKKCPPKDGKDYPIKMAAGGDPLGPLGVSAKNYIASKKPRLMSDGEYEYMVDNPWVLEASPIRSRRLGTDAWVDWNDTNMGGGKRETAIERLRQSFPDSFSPIEPSLQSLTGMELGPEEAGVAGQEPRPSFDLPKLDGRYTSDAALSGTALTPQNPGPTVASTMADKIQKDDSNPLFNMLESNLNDMELENKQNYEGDVASASDLFDRKNKLATGAAIVNSLQGLQDTYYEPAKGNTSLLGAKYRRMPISALEQQAAALRSNTASIGRELLKEGVRPSEVGAILGNAQGRAMDAESNLRFNFFDKNMTLDRSRFGELKSTIDANEQSRIAADRASRDDQNKLFSAQVDNIGNLLDNRDKLATDEHVYGREIKRGYNDNRMSLVQNRFNLTGMRDLSERARKDTDNYLSELSKYFEKYKKDYYKK